MFAVLLDTLEMDLRAALNTAVTGLVATARTRLEVAIAELEDERTRGLAEVADERAKGLADVDRRQRELSREIEAMQRHKEAQEGVWSSTSAGTATRRQCRRCDACRTLSSMHTSAAGTRKTCVATAAYLLIATASTLVTSRSTCATAWCR
jgi:hypothetical protein